MYIIIRFTGQQIFQCVNVTFSSRYWMTCSLTWMNFLKLSAFEQLKNKTAATVLADPGVWDRICRIFETEATCFQQKEPYHFKDRPDHVNRSLPFNQARTIKMPCDRSEQLYFPGHTQTIYVSPRRVNLILPLSSSIEQIVSFDIHFEQCPRSLLNLSRNMATSFLFQNWSKQLVPPWVQVTDVGGISCRCSKNH